MHSPVGALAGTPRSTRAPRLWAVDRGCDATTDLYWRRVTPSEVLGDIPQRLSLNSPNSQVGNDDIGQRLR
jgi:hypothetical protein